MPEVALRVVLSIRGHSLNLAQGKSLSNEGAIRLASLRLPQRIVLGFVQVIRVDGRKIHDMHLFEVKKPGESNYFGDFYKHRATIPATEACPPLKDDVCPLVGR
jgi:branched-chain amino acid transport system substrate-binding protein